MNKPTPRGFQSIPGIFHAKLLEGQTLDQRISGNPCIRKTGDVSASHIAYAPGMRRTPKESYTATSSRQTSSSLLVCTLRFWTLD